MELRLVILQVSIEVSSILDRPLLLFEKSIAHDHFLQLQKRIVWLLFVIIQILFLVHVILFKFEDSHVLKTKLRVIFIWAIITLQIIFIFLYDFNEF